MRLAFVVTAYNIETFIGPCLQRLAPCLQAGDQLIVVDDGSSDETGAAIETALEALEAPEVTITPIYLGTNTPGGVGIPGNVGIREALAGPCEGLFFVDGDDLVCPEGLAAARRRFEAADCDLMIADYRVLQDPDGHLLPPPDAALWQEMATAADAEARRQLALRMVGVPWRKFYRMALLRGAELRFPEGAFFYEDGPFHWQACLAARDIRFVQEVVCHHRIGRAGQTMAARGIELAAFFDHYDRIIAGLPRGRYRPDALRWLLENMAWHVDQLAPEAYWAYGARAQQTLARVTPGDWRALQGDPVAERASAMALALAQGQLAAVVAGWQGRAVMQRMTQLETRIADLAQAQAEQGARLERVLDWIEGQSALQEFMVLKARAGQPPQD